MNPDSDVFVTTMTSRGAVCGTSFGIGVDISGTYTGNEILEAGWKLRKMIPECDSEPYWLDTFNQYAWLPWDRLSIQYCDSIRHRTQLDTFHKCDPDDYYRYLGVSDYVTTWPMYISTSSRIQAITTHFKTIQNLRILELGCGCGHQLLPLAAHGADVFGLELNPLMFSARHKLLRSNIMFGDALIDPWLIYKQNSFDVLIVSMLGFVNYADLLEFFTGLAFITSNNGLLLLDLVEKTKSTGKIRPVSSYKPQLRTAGFTAKYVTSDQLVCIKNQQ